MATALKIPRRHILDLITISALSSIFLEESREERKKKERKMTGGRCEATPRKEVVSIVLIGRKECAPRVHY